MATILIIDDDDYIRILFQEFLSKEGYDILLAKNGYEGIQVYKKFKPDLVITDIIMPEKEGLKMIQELKNEFAEIKIIAISGGGMSRSDSFLNVAKELGAIYVLEKPVRRQNLIQAVEKAFS